jgi:hypothetical protein
LVKGPESADAGEAAEPMARRPSESRKCRRRRTGSTPVLLHIAGAADGAEGVVEDFAVGRLRHCFPMALRALPIRARVPLNPCSN